MIDAKIAELRARVEAGEGIGSVMLKLLLDEIERQRIEIDWLKAELTREPEWSALVEKLKARLAKYEPEPIEGGKP